MKMLKIKNLKAGIEDKEILTGINLEVKPGEVHAIMGPNGSGKSTLSSVIAGKEEYEVTEGEIIFDGEDIGVDDLCHLKLLAAAPYFAWRRNGRLL